MKSNKRIRFAVYGSLREGMYNYHRFKQIHPDIQIVKRSIDIQGYDLFTLGSYPAIRRGRGSIKADVIECSLECAGKINTMEFNAGYIATELFIDNISTIIFEYDAPINSERFISSGDWVEFINNKINTNG